MIQGGGRREELPGGIGCECVGEDVREVECVDVPWHRRGAVGLGGALVGVGEGLSEGKVARDEGAVLGGGHRAAGGVGGYRGGEGGGAQAIGGGAAETRHVAVLGRGMMHA